MRPITWWNKHNGQIDSIRKWKWIRNKTVICWWRNTNVKMSKNSMQKLCEVLWMGLRTVLIRFSKFSTWLPCQHKFYNCDIYQVRMMHIWCQNSILQFWRCHVKVSSFLLVAEMLNSKLSLFALIIENFMSRWQLWNSKPVMKFWKSFPCFVI